MEQNSEVNEVSAINAATKVEEVCQLLKDSGFPENIVRKFEEEYIDGEGFLELANDMMYVKLIPQYGLQVKFKRFFKKVTGRELICNIASTVPVQQMAVEESLNDFDKENTQDSEATINEIPHLSKERNRLVPYPAPLPVFTELVQARLRQGNGLSCLNKVIGELADFYIARGYSISTSPKYRNVGRTMVEMYPSLAMPGNTATPWQAFCKSLSARIRNQRCSLKRKSDVLTEKEGNLSPRNKVLKESGKVSFGVEGEDMPVLSNEKYVQYVEEMKTECDKGPKVDKKHLRTLMRNTFRKRRDYIQSLPDGDVQTIITEFPVLKMESGIFEEMKLVIGKEKFDCLSDEFDKVMLVIEKMRGLAPLDEDCSDSMCDKRDLENLSYLHRETMYERGKGAKSKPFWKEVEVTKDLKKALECGEEEPPFVVFCVHSEKVKGIYICADGKIIVKSSQNDIRRGILLLLSAYYAFDLQYPKVYSQALGFLQECIIGHKFDKNTTQKLKKFLAKYSFESGKHKQN